MFVFILLIYKTPPQLSYFFPFMFNIIYLANRCPPHLSTGDAVRLVLSGRAGGGVDNVGLKLWLNESLLLKRDAGTFVRLG